MRYITPSILFALFTLGFLFYFLWRYFTALHNRPADLQWVRGERKPLRFAGSCHPTDRKDRILLLLITLLYACTAFFRLGSFSSPQTVRDFGDGEALLIRVKGEPFLASGIRYFSGLGTGGYNVEISSDGEHWSTLWQRKEDPNDPKKVTGYYWADAEGYSPSYALTQNYNQLFKWIDVTVSTPQYVQYLRITGKADPKHLTVTDAQGNSDTQTQRRLELAKFCFLGKDGQPVDFQWTAAGEEETEVLTALFDLSHVPETSHWLNSAYFDEIYHARTAKEHVDGVYPYEVTHPPLGKLLIGLGVSLFGMTPFGWRFTGTLLGVLMLPILYIFLKNMFGKTPVAACGTVLFATEFMHLTQTRISTIDTYAVFFILGMYFFMYRYLTLPAGTPFWKGALPLFLSGLMWGLGAASKWTVFYAGIGLAVLYFMGLFQKLRDWPKESEVPKGPWLCATLLFSVLCFVLIPFAIYTASYLPYAKALGVDTSLGATLRGLGEGFPLLLQNLMDKLTGAAAAEGYRAADIPNDTLSGIMLKNQWYMLTYHNGVHQAHPYSSWWFQWIVDARPILYYMDNSVSGFTTRFAAFANPVLCWGGLGAILICGAHAFQRLWTKALFLGGLGVFAAAVTALVGQNPNGILDPELGSKTLGLHLALLVVCLLLYLVLCALVVFAAPGSDAKALFLLVAYLSQLVPWWFIGRTTFEYHYFPSLLFLVFALCYLFDGLIRWDRKWTLPVYGLTGLSVGLYALFYPVLIGLRIPTWYEPLVKWIESWPF